MRTAIEDVRISIASEEFASMVHSDNNQIHEELSVFLFESHNDQKISPATPLKKKVLHMTPPDRLFPSILCRLVFK